MCWICNLCIFILYPRAVGRFKNPAEGGGRGARHHRAIGRFENAEGRASSIERFLKENILPLFLPKSGGED